MGAEAKRLLGNPAIRSGEQPNSGGEKFLPP
jgi:hypothetical protein